MMYETLLIERKESIGIIVLNRPDKFNTINSIMADELNHALGMLDNEDETAIVVIKGAGKSFSTGIDLAEYGGKSATEYREWVSRMDAMHGTVASMKKPVIAMLHGYVVANGAGLMAAADFAVIAEDAKIGTTAVNLGLLCSGPLSPMMSALSKKQALELLLCGEMIGAHDALRLGLVNRVVPAERLEEETFAFAEKLLSKSPLAVTMGKTFYYEAADMTVGQRLSHSSEVFARLCVSEDADEGVRAFKEKKKPVWKGK